MSCIMSDNVQTAMFEILKSVQTNIGDLKSQVDGLNSRFANLEQGQVELKELARKQRRDVAGIMVMMKSVAGDFDERVSALERRMTAQEAIDRRS